MNIKSFAAKYITCLKKIFVNHQDTQTCCSSLALEFAVKFLIFLINVDPREDEKFSENVIQFWTSVFDFLKEVSSIISFGNTC